MFRSVESIFQGRGRGGVGGGGEYMVRSTSNNNMIDVTIGAPITSVPWDCNHFMSAFFCSQTAFKLRLHTRYGAFP